jgi:hypothetical protein
VDVDEYLQEFEDEEEDAFCDEDRQMGVTVTSTNFVRRSIHLQ